MKQQYSLWVTRAIALLIVPYHSFVWSLSAYAGEIPAYAQITQILGPNNVGLRVNGRPIPTNVGGRLDRSPDALFLPGNDRTFANLDFYNSTGQSRGTRVQARTRNDRITFYYFPCTLSVGGSAIIEWGNQVGGSRGCDTGFRVQSAPRRTGAQLLEEDQPYALRSKQLLNAQASSTRFQYYCSVVSNSGQGWIDIQSSGDPCQKPLQQCKAMGGTCTTVALDRWTTRDPELTALVSCNDNKVFTERGSGATMPEVASQVWQQAQTQSATACALHVLAPDELIAVPLSNGERTIVEVHDADPCLTFKVVSGSAIVASAKHPEGVPLQFEQQYRYCDEKTDDPIETFDASIESIDLQVFLARERSYQFCDQQQASGGQEGDRRTIQLTATEGEIRIDYEMFSVPDRLQVSYEGQSLLDTGFISGSQQVSVPFKGNSGQVTVDLTGNIESASTRWNYTLYCP